MDDINAFLVFARVVEEGSFTAAAERLGESKSAVSKQIGRLEDSLGTRLLNRTTRRMSLTEAGAIFYDRVRRVVEEVEEARVAVSQLQATPRGTLRVSAPVSFGISHIAPILPDFMRRYPDLQVDISLTDHQVDLVDEGIDVAVRIGALTDTSLIARRIRDYNRLIVASPDYWRKNGMPEHPSALSDHNCLTYAYFASGRTWRMHDPDGGEIAVRVGGSMNANNGEILLRAAEAGLGIIQSPIFLCEEAVAAGRLVPALQDFRFEPVGLHAVFPHARNLSTKVRVFVDFLVERFNR
ncbi:LysR family transcriptional regulator [Hwanghaeella sp.]|uniref:LysR family transcriptional regulator n=1 Tax=Hwanghaeella sp. TaxID=2605943 RepID=UPI003CCBE1D7